MLHGWKMKHEMAVLAELLNIFGGRKVICLLDSMSGLTVYKFLGSWEIQAWFIRIKQFNVLLWPPVGAAKLSKSEGKGSFGNRLHKHKVESFQVVVSGSDSQLMLLHKFFCYAAWFSLLLILEWLYQSIEVQGGSASDAEGL